jgi:hypothetical protein
MSADVAMSGDVAESELAMSGDVAMSGDDPESELAMSAAAR